MTLFSSPKRPEPLWGPPALLFNGNWNSVSGTLSSPTSSAEAKNEISCISTNPPTSLVYHHGVHRNNFTFATTCNVKTLQLPQCFYGLAFMCFSKKKKAPVMSRKSNKRLNCNGHGVCVLRCRNLILVYNVQ